MKKKILYITSSLAIGGTEIHLLLVSKGLKERGFEISFFCFGPTSEIGQQLIEAGITVSSTETRKNSSVLFSMLHFLLFLKRTKPDIVHFFLPKAYILGAPIAWLAGHRHMIMSRRSLNNYQRKYCFASRIESLLHKLMKNIVGNSQKVIDQLEQDEKVTKDKLRLIYNGVKIQIPSTDYNRIIFRNNLNLDKDAFVFIIVANLITYKGHRDLIDAFAMIKDQLPSNWRLLCVGRDGGILENLEQQVVSANIQSHVQFLGQRDDIIDLFYSSDVGLLVSHEEGFSNAILEAMSAGLPMIVTDVGGNTEVIKDGENGYVVPSHNSVELSKALLTLALDNSTQERMSQNNRRKIEEHFTLEDCIDQYTTLYRAHSLSISN